MTWRVCERLFTLIEYGTHAVIDADFGAVSEQALARRVLGQLGQGMFTHQRSINFGIARGSSVVGCDRL